MTSSLYVAGRIIAEFTAHALERQAFSLAVRHRADLMAIQGRELWLVTSANFPSPQALWCQICHGHFHLWFPRKLPVAVDKGANARHVPKTGKAKANTSGHRLQS